jgi:hypothetical protein
MRYLITAIVFLCFLAACNKPAADSAGNTSLVAKWKLTDYLVSPGPMGEWQKADPSSPSYITFKNDGSLEITPDNEYSAKRYRVLSDSAVLMIRENDSLPFRYEIKKDRLTLYPPCIEPCANKYVKVSGLD